MRQLTDRLESYAYPIPLQSQDDDDTTKKKKKIVNRNSSVFIVS
jgi:hypothetical protein